MKPFCACILILIILSFTSCSIFKKSTGEKESSPATKTVKNNKPKTFIKPVNIDRKEFVSFAKTMLGVPYKYGSANPENGLDCSGFITVVFNHFHVKAPRSSVDFTYEGEDVNWKEAAAGDIILFTGSDNSTGIVGHMGIVTKTGNIPQFIHSASGKNVGVIISNFSGYYVTHFVKLIRILQ